MAKKKPQVLVQDTSPDTFTGNNVSQLYVDTTQNNRMADEQLAQGAKPEPTLKQGVEAAWDSETTTAALFSWLASPKHVPDPNFRIKDWDAASEGINPEYHGALLGATSEGELQDKRNQILKEQKDRDTLSRMGNTGIGLALGAAILDPVGIALAATTAPLGASVKASRISNIFRGGLAAGSSNAALEGYLATQQETRDATDIAWAGLIGFGFGNVGGMLSKHNASKLTSTANDLSEVMHLDKIKKDADSNTEIKLTPEGEARYQDLTNPVKAKVVPSVSPKVVPEEVKAAPEALPLISDLELNTRDDIKDSIDGPLDELLGDVNAKPAPQIAPGSTQVAPDSLAPQKPPSVQPEVSSAAYKVGDDISVETFDGAMVSGVVRSYNPETGKMVIMDDATGKPKTVNLNEDEVTDVFDFSGSVGSAQIAGTHIDKTTDAAFIEARIPGTDYKIPLRFDYYSIFARSKNVPLREMSEKLLSNSTGNKFHDARDLNASEIAVLEQNVQRGRYTAAVDEAYAAKVKENDWNWFEARKNRQAFNEAVTSAVRGNSTNQFADPHLGPVVATIQKITQEILEKMKKYGVEGAEDVDPNPFYMMRRFNHEKILQLKSRFSSESLQELISKALKAVRPLDDIQAKRIAKQYYNIVKAIPYEDMGRLQMGEAGRARLRMVAQNEGVDEDLIDEIIDLVLAKPDGAGKKEGDSPRLKHRTLMDEEYTTTLKGRDGKDYEVSMKDFFENDATVLMEMYTRQTGGLIGLARMGIRSEADWAKLKRNAAQAAEEAGEDPARHAKEMKHMEDVYSNIVGRPMSTEIYGKQERVLKGLRDLNFIRLMGQVGVAQMSELAATLATAGTRAMAMHMPAFKDIIRMGKLGQIDDELQRDLLNMTGMGAEMRGQQVLGRNMDDVFHDPRLSKIENGLNEGRKGIAMISGLAPVTNIMRQMTARMFSQKTLDFATGHAKLTEAKKKRLAWMGIGDDNRAAVFKDMQTYMKTNNPKQSKLEEIEWEKWEKESPDTYMTFRMAIWRESRRIAQESTIGETMPLMHTQLGKVMLQFRGFMLVGHAKNMLNALHHRDMEAATVFMASMLGTSLAYVAQTSINFAGDEEKLKEKLAIDRIALAAFQRTGFSTLIPAVTDFGMQAAGHEGIFRDGRVSGQATALVTGNPTYDLVVNKAGGTAKNLLQNVTTDDYQATQKDVKNAMSMILPNVFGVRNFINEVASGYPTYNDQREYSRQ